jgi:transcription-repair coupling factor (superfamily II helicase)
MAAPGHAFGPDTPWQRELEDAFPYVETPDQLEAIEEVKADMEKPVPMDRVVMGDVGYGKTEIAVGPRSRRCRTASRSPCWCRRRCWCSSTTAPSATASRPFPVKVRAVSRFNSDKEQKEVMDGVTDGSVDVVIGTHRLLSKDTQFKDLGLVIVDEEQRFGVEHKEFIKQMRTRWTCSPCPRRRSRARSR